MRARQRRRRGTRRTRLLATAAASSAAALATRPERPCFAARTARSTRMSRIRSRVTVSIGVTASWIGVMEPKQRSSRVAATMPHVERPPSETSRRGRAGRAHARARGEEPSRKGGEGGAAETVVGGRASSSPPPAERGAAARTTTRRARVARRRFAPTGGERQRAALVERHADLSSSSLLGLRLDRAQQPTTDRRVEGARPRRHWRRSP